MTTAHLLAEAIGTAELSISIVPASANFIGDETVAPVDFAVTTIGEASKKEAIMHFVKKIDLPAGTRYAVFATCSALKTDAYRAQVEAMGGDNIARLKIVEAIADGKIKVVPRCVGIGQWEWKAS